MPLSVSLSLTLGPLLTADAALAASVPTVGCQSPGTTRIQANHARFQSLVPQTKIRSQRAF